MRKNKKGFTLVELLAVIVILAIIMIIATQSVGKTVTRSRTQAFSETMELAVKNAKRILQTDGTLTVKALKDSLGYSTSEYDFQVNPSEDGDGYLMMLISNPSGKFKNVDFNTMSEKEKNTNWIYTMNADNKVGRNIIGFKIDSVGDIKKIEDNSLDKKIVEDTLQNNCTQVSNLYDPRSKDDSIKEVSFCNKNVIYMVGDEYVKGKSEDFYVIREDNSTIYLLAKNNLKVGVNDDESDRFYNLQAQDIYTHSVKFSEKIYWHKSGVNTKDKYPNVWQDGYFYYPAYVYDDNASIKNYVDRYINYLNDSFAISATGRLLNHIDIRGISGEKINSSNNIVVSKFWKNIICGDKRGFWTGIAKKEEQIFSVLKESADGSCVIGVQSYDAVAVECAESSCETNYSGVRPVIEIKKTELEKYLNNQ